MPHSKKTPHFQKDIQLPERASLRCIFLILALSFLPGTAVGLTFSVPLPELVGVVGFPPNQGQTTSFDFGQQFSDIQSVSIEIEAHVFAQEFDVCGTAFNPRPCVHEVQLLGFFVQLDTEGGPVFSRQGSGGLSFGDFRDLEGYGVDTVPFDDQFVQLGFEYLFDGAGSLTLFWNRALGNPDRIIQNVVEASGEIFSARLIIEATPIPEPSTVLLVAAGLLVLSGTRPHD